MNFIKKHAHHLVFIITIAALVALLAWWFVFIRDSIRVHELVRVENLDVKLNNYAQSLGFDASLSPPVGVLALDDRFEIGLCETFEEARVRPLLPNWPDLCIRVHPEVLEALKEESRSLNFMLMGESGLLVLIIFITSVFLYRFIQLERRTTREIQMFWERSAHEIKTPITGIKAFLQNLKSRSYSQEEMIPYVDMALSQVERQEQMAENLLSGYQLAAKKRAIRLENVELKGFLREYFERSPLKLAGDVVHLNFLEGEAVSVRADRNGLRVILDNIVNNAMRFCPSGLELTVDLERERDQGVVVISDNGPGFSPKYREAIFSAYRHLGAELPEGRHGTGIGLYISRELARSMGGDLRAESGGEGAQFLLSLNLAKT